MLPDGVVGLAFSGDANGVFFDTAGITMNRVWGIDGPMFMEPHLESRRKVQTEVSP